MTTTTDRRDTIADKPTAVPSLDDLACVGVPEATVNAYLRDHLTGLLAEVGRLTQAIADAYGTGDYVDGDDLEDELHGIPVAMNPILDADGRRVVRVWLTMGGPNIGIDLPQDRAWGEMWIAWGGTRGQVPVSPEKRERLERAWGLQDPEDFFDADWAVLEEEAADD